MEPLPSVGGRGERGTAPSVGKADSSPMLRTGEPLRNGGGNMEEYTKGDYIRFIGELLELLPVGFVRKIYSIVANERRRAGV